MEYSQPNFLTALEDGTFTFAYGISPWLFALLVVLITIGVWFVYRKTTRQLSTPWKAFFIGIRSSVLVLLLFCLLRPVVTTLQVSPQETYLAVLIDDSQSMAIADLPDGQTRQAAVEEQLYENGLLDGLS